MHRAHSKTPQLRSICETLISEILQWKPLPSTSNKNADEISFVISSIGEIISDLCRFIRLPYRIDFGFANRSAFVCGSREKFSCGDYPMFEVPRQTWYPLLEWKFITFHYIHFIRNQLGRNACKIVLITRKAFLFFARLKIERIFFARTLMNAHRHICTHPTIYHIPIS